MLVITTRCDHPGCEGRVRFSDDGARRASLRRLGSCDRCQRLYSLDGGQIEALPQPSGGSGDGPPASMPERSSG
jgi:hypothetical protein